MGVVHPLQHELVEVDVAGPAERAVGIAVAAYLPLSGGPGAAADALQAGEVSWGVGGFAVGGAGPGHSAVVVPSG